MTDIAIINKFDSIASLVGSRHGITLCMLGPHAIRPVNMHYSNMTSRIIELLLTKEKE